jgi:hypothetical protein
MADIILPAQSLTTELEAVNILIASLGEEPVTTLTPSPTPDVDKALIALNETMRDVQSRGWQWNKEVAFPFTADPVTGQIILPPNTLELSKAYYIPNQISGCQPWDIVLRGQTLYNRYTKSYNFSTYGTVYCDLTLLLEWSLVPQKARRVITLEAVGLFQSRDQMASPTMQVNAQELARAWALLEQGEDQEAMHNQIYDNLDSVSKILGQGSMRRNRINGW